MGIEAGTNCCHAWWFVETSGAGSSCWDLPQGVPAALGTSCLRLKSASTRQAKKKHNGSYASLFPLFLKQLFIHVKTETVTNLLQITTVIVWIYLDHISPSTQSLTVTFCRCRSSCREPRRADRAPARAAGEDSGGAKRGSVKRRRTSSTWKRTVGASHGRTQLFIPKIFKKNGSWKKMVCFCWVVFFWRVVSWRNEELKFWTVYNCCHNNDDLGSDSDNDKSLLGFASTALGSASEFLKRLTTSWCNPVASWLYNMIKYVRVRGAWKHPN